jgi:hypothetical protein
MHMLSYVHTSKQMIINFQWNKKLSIKGIRKRIEIFLMLAIGHKKGNQPQCMYNKTSF